MRKRFWTSKAMAYGSSLALCGSLLATTPAQASENGTFGNYGIGAQTIAAGFLPPPGASEAYGYLLYYTADSFRDDNGRSSIPGFKADLLVQAVRLAHTWDFTFHGLTFSSSVIGESIYARIEAGGIRDKAFGPDLIDIDPIHVSVKLGNWYLQTGPFFYLPLGEYDRNALANSTTHYATIAQQVSATWLPSPKWELSLDGNVSFNFRNKDTGYRSGNLFGLTYGIGYRPFAFNPKWQLGINGYYVRQFTDDHSFGEPVPTGVRLRKFSVGPQVTYWFSPALAVVLKWQHETEARNAPRGDLIWAQFAFPI